MKSKKEPSPIRVEKNKDESEERAIARMALSPSFQSALTYSDYSKTYGELDLMSLADELKHQIGQTVDGNLDRAEAMLTSQAHTLDAIFGNLARRAIHAEYLPQFDTYLKLGLRAQSQCRATWETLATIKNPVGRAYVGQANFAHNQQVNNKTDPSRMRKKENPPNVQLEKTDGKRLDSGTPQQAVKSDQALETVGKKHRSKNKKR